MTAATQDQSYSTRFTVDQTPDEVFRAVTNPRGWWSEDISGATAKRGDVFQYRYKDVHRCEIELAEIVAGEKVVWHVRDNEFNFVKDKTEWKGTDIVFEIAKKGDRTELHFTHVGLVPDYECFDVCTDAWGRYIGGSLKSLITTGAGRPNLKE